MTTPTPCPCGRTPVERRAGSRSYLRRLVCPGCGLATPYQRPEKLAAAWEEAVAEERARRGCGRRSPRDAREGRMTMSRTAAMCLAAVIVGLVLVIGGWEPAPRMQMSTFQEERLPR